MGTWSGLIYGDPNLLFITDGFDVENVSAIISKVDSNTIMGAFTADGGAGTFSLDVADGRATLNNVPVTIGSIVYHAFSIVTDGSGLSWYSVTTELSDPTDVSVSVSLMTKQ